jgi:predicted amidohydrolase
MPLTFSLIQTKLYWENKQANLEMLEAKIRSIAKTEIVVLPEMFSTGFSINTALAETMDGQTVTWMKKIAAEQKIILTGSLMIQEAKHYYNRLIWMLPNAQLGYYDKRHCFSYAEEHKHYTPGHKRLITSVKGWKINLQICYDLRFPVWARQSFNKAQIDKEYDVLLYVANWPERRNHAWKSLLVARAIENQCYVVAVNRVGNDGNDVYHSGDSMIINPLGEILFTNTHDEIIHTEILEKKVLEEVRTRFAFWKDADDFRILNEE